MGVIKQHGLFTWVRTHVSWPLLLALLLSLLLHLLLLAEVGWPAWFTHDQADTPVLQARLVLPPKPVLPAPAAATPRPAVRKPAPANTSVKPELAAPASDVRAVSEAASTAEAAAMAQAAEAAREAEIAAWHEDHSQVTEEAEIAPTPYTHVATEFAMFLNEDASPVGTAKIDYAQVDSEHYTLRWQVQGSGLLKLLYPKLVQESRGEVRPHGLRPYFYRYAFGSRVDKTHEATFDWDKRLLTLKTGDQQESHDLPQNAQDILSFMFQFMFVPPLQEMHVVLTNGRRMGEYEYEFEGEEPLQVADQTLQTVHLAHTRGEQSDKIDFWLASEYRYIPVKIRIINKKGQVIEQVATRIEAW